MFLHTVHGSLSWGCMGAWESLLGMYDFFFFFLAEILFNHRLFFQSEHVSFVITLDTSIFRFLPRISI